MEFQQLRLIPLLVIGAFGLFSAWAGTAAIWRYLHDERGWGEVARAWAILGVGIAMFLGGWIVFDVLWLARRVVTLALHATIRPKPSSS
jgi:hypothetical protein